MHSKKIAIGLLILAVGTLTFFLFNPIRVKGVFAETIKQNVVYTNRDNLVVSQNNTKLSKDTDEAFKVKSIDTLKKYFNQSPKINKDSYYYTAVLNEKALGESEANQLKMLQDAFEKKQLSDEQFNKQKGDIKKERTALNTTISKLKHGVIQSTWINGEEVYLVFFNENTKEVEFTLGNKPHDKSAMPLTTSKEQLRNIAENFIKQNKLGDIESPKFMLENGKNLFYQEEKDLAKKAMINIDPYTGKVSGFAVKAYADMLYDEIITSSFSEEN